MIDDMKTASAMREFCYNNAKVDLEENNEFQKIYDAIKESAEKGGDFIIREKTLWDFLVIKNYFEKLYYRIEILSNKSLPQDLKYKSLITFKISW